MNQTQLTTEQHWERYSQLAGDLVTAAWKHAYAKANGTFLERVRTRGEWAKIREQQRFHLRAALMLPEV